MRIRLSETRTVKVNGLSKRTYPPGIYEIADQVILDQLTDIAEALPPESAADLNPGQVAALAAVADNVLANAASEARAALMNADLEHMTVADLRQLAQVCGVAVDPKAKKADLVVALHDTRTQLAMAE